MQCTLVVRRTYQLRFLNSKYAIWTVLTGRFDKNWNLLHAPHSCGCVYVWKAEHIRNWLKFHPIYSSNGTCVSRHAYPFSHWKTITSTDRVKRKLNLNIQQRAKIYSKYKSSASSRIIKSIRLEESLENFPAPPPNF